MPFNNSCTTDQDQPSVEHEKDQIKNHPSVLLLVTGIRSCNTLMHQGSDR